MPGESPWTEEPSGLQSMGSEKSHAAKHSTAQDTRVINKDRDITRDTHTRSLTHTKGWH